MIILIIHIIVSYDQNISLIFLCERYIPCQAVTSVLCLHYCPETVHCSTKDVYTSEITFLALHPWTIPNNHIFLKFDFLQRVIEKIFCRVKKNHLISDKDANFRFTTVPLKPLFDQVWIGYNFENGVFSMFLNKSDLRISYVGKQILIIRIKHFLKTDIIFHSID